MATGADVTVIDLQRKWTYGVAASASKFRNSPFHGWKFRGSVAATVVNGEIVWRQDGQG